MSSPTARLRWDRRTVLVLGANEAPALTRRLLILGFHAIPAATAAEVAEAITLGRHVAAVLVEIEEALRPGGEALGLLEKQGDPAPRIVVGPEPGESARVRLRERGLVVALWQPFDDNDLRSVLIRAVSAARLQRRGDERVSTSLRANVLSSTGIRTAILANLSRSGAFLETTRAAQVGARLELELLLPGQILRVEAKVILTNVAGNLQRPDLPLGMSVRFVRPGREVEDALEAFVLERIKRFVV